MLCTTADREPDSALGMAAFASFPPFGGQRDRFAAAK